MTSQETLRPWTPISGLPDIMYCRALRDDESGVQIDLSTEGAGRPIVRVTFDTVIAYQNVNETYRHRTWLRIQGSHPTLMLVEGSAWLSWLKHESGGLLDDVGLTHYAIYTPEDCIDIISRSPPTVTRLG